MSATVVKTAAMPAPADVRVEHLLFLGPEWLTWLYFEIVIEGGSFDLKKEAPHLEGADEVLFAIGKRVVLSSIDGGAKVTLSGPGLADNGEIMSAVRRGAQLQTLALDASIGHRVYSFTLESDGVMSLKLPDLFSEPEDDKPADGGVDTTLPGAKKRARRPVLPFEDILSLRAQCAAEVECVIDALFGRFLKRRLSTRWVTHDVANIRSVVGNGLRARLVEGIPPTTTKKVP